MNVRFELAGARPCTRFVAQHFRETRRMPHLARQEVELEQRVLRAGDGALETFLSVAQLVGLTRDLVAGLFLPRHVPVDAENARRQSCALRSTRACSCNDWAPSIVR